MVAGGPVEPVGCGDAVLDTPSAVLTAALEAYVAINSDGQVVAWNPAAVALFGYTREQACGQPVDQLIIPERFRAAHHAGLARLAAGGRGRVLGQRLQLAALHRDGQEFPIEMTLTVTDTSAGRRFHAFAHDITAVQRASRFAAVEAAVSRGLAEAPSSTVAAQRVVEALGVRMGWPVTELWLLDQARQVLVCAGRHTADHRGLGAFALDEFDLGVGLPGTVCRTGQPRWIADLATDRTWLRSRAAARIGLHVAASVPVACGGRVLGALCVFGDRVEDPQDAVLGLLGGLAAQVGQYLERRRTEELAVELARTKEEFVTLITHELRNPLAVITATTELAVEELGRLTLEQHREYLDIIAQRDDRTPECGPCRPVARAAGLGEPGSAPGDDQNVR